MPVVSAIITAHDRSHLLPGAIESVLAQTFGDYELIVVDDASADETPQILRRYEAEGCLRSVRINQSRGANHARSQGVETAIGEYLAFLDDDDLWLPHKLERQVQVFQSVNGVALVGSWFLKQGRVQTLTSRVSYNALLSRNVLSSFSNCMFRKRDLMAVGGMDETLQNSQDWDLWLRLGEFGQIVVVPECLVHYNTDQLDRITDRRDRTAYYANYLAVVKRHQHKMGLWQRRMHHCLVAYHTTSKSRRLARVYRGALYLLCRMVDRILNKVQLGITQS